ncbi:hypothetical protein PMAYCL1PPCAC_30181, partial [Pristionchus mayeri]
DGGFNKQFLQPSDNLHVFIPYLERSFVMTFHDATTHDSVPTYIYRIDRDQYNTNNAKIMGIEYENEGGIDYFPSWPSCPLDHVYSPSRTKCAIVDCSTEENLCDECCNGSTYGQKILTPPGFFPEKIIPGQLIKNPVPVFLSPPHMLWAPMEVSSIYKGQYPNEEEHQPIEWGVNPTMGSVIRVHFRIQ